MRYVLSLDRSVTPGRAFEEIPPPVGYVCKFVDRWGQPGLLTGTVLAIVREPGAGIDVRIVRPHPTSRLVGTLLREWEPAWVKDCGLDPGERVVLVWP